MMNNMMELSLEEMKTIDGAGLLGSIGQVVKTVAKVADGTNHTKNCTQKVPEEKKAPANGGNSAPENAVLSIFTNITKCFLKTL